MIFDFLSLRVILNDALYTLIVLAIVKTLFINNSFDYAITFFGNRLCRYIAKAYFD